MAPHQAPAEGMDFWSALGITPEGGDRPEAGASQDTSTPPEPEPEGEQQETGNDWFSMFSASDSDSADEDDTAEADEQEAPPQAWPETPAFPQPQAPASRKPPAQTAVPQTPPSQAPAKQTKNWFSMFSGSDSADENGTAEPSGQQAAQAAPAQPPVQVAGPQEPPAQTPAPQPAATPTPPPQTAAPQTAGIQTPAPLTPPMQTAVPQASPTQAPPAQTPPAQTPVPQTAAPQAAAQAPDSAGPRTQVSADPAWLAAEQIANSLRPQMSKLWMELLSRYTDGDQVMTGRVYDVLSGSHLLGELWRDERVDEVHIQGTEVTVCGTNGVYQVPGFPSLAAAQRAIATIKASREKTGAVISRVGASVVVSRRRGTGLDATALVTGGIATEEQLAQIKQALEGMQAVTVTGPAARIVVRALAALIPVGSRVFLAAYATLPAGCIAAAHPMEADYVIGVRPGAVAERMAAAGQVGALIANPETAVPTALRFAVSGQSAALGKLTPLT
ncbi:hypothetical protein GCM10010191_09980 [Actinomadura vinacea]|uniref:Uncharacterized protein n=1 Tax=Actinomadura vinacea TaxID=115336 RepID=A0ABP5VIT6_9ACTN